MNTITDKNSNHNSVKTKISVLLIDNKITALALIHEMLEELGYSVISFCQVLDALTSYKNIWKEIDIVAVGMHKPDYENRIAVALRGVNPDARILFYNREQVAAGLYIYHVGYEGFKTKIDHLMNN